jgi:hypothetical protein
MAGASDSRAFHHQGQRARLAVTAQSVPDKDRLIGLIRGSFKRNSAIAASTSDRLIRNWRSRIISGGGLGGGELLPTLLLFLGFLFQFFAALFKLIIRFLHF